MYAVIGLGNPGAQYANTRHNMGFWALENLAAKLQIGGKWKEKGGCRFVRADIGEEEVFLVQPQRYMNRSGEAIQPFLAFFKIPPKAMIVVYDELDLDPGALRLKKGGSAGGHQGVEDIITHLSSTEFYRIRIGIGHPRKLMPDKPIEVADYVLGHPQGAELRLLKKTCETAASAVEMLIEDGLEAAQRKFHVKAKVE